MADAKSGSSSVFLNQPEPKPRAGTKKPLFDRLIDDNSEQLSEHPKKMLLNKSQYIESIVNEIDRVLNTRLSATAKIYTKYKDVEYGMGLPWMYGIPDFTSIDASDKTGWPRLAKIFANTISYFEPRLQMVKVTIDQFDGSNQSLHISVRGQISIQKHQQPVFFGLQIRDLSKSGA
jgi:type VI secretion system lysozyme-like protein